MKKRLFGTAIVGLTMAAGFCGSQEAAAVPSLEVEQTYVQPDGTAFAATQYGDEFFNYVAGEDGSVYVKKADDYWYYQVNGLSRSSVEAKVGIDSKPSGTVNKTEVVKQGNGAAERQQFSDTLRTQQNKVLNKEQNLLVVLVEFNDIKISTTEEEWHQKIFGSDGKTMKNFFSEQTNKRMEVKPAKETAAVKNGILKVQMDQEHPDMGNGFNSFELSANILQRIKDKVDFSIYDRDKNNYIEPDELHVMFIIAGYEQSSGKHGKSVWGHKGWSSHLTTVNGLKFTDFTMFGEKMRYKDEDVSSSIGVICHEFGHDIGLPDLYNTEQVNGAADGYGVGIVSLMAQGAWGADRTFNGMYWETDFWGSSPVGLDAYSKIQLGVPFESLDRTLFYEKDVKAVSAADPTILKLQSINPNEYFLIENRQMNGFDRGMFRYTENIPGGILVYRVNTTFGQNHGIGRQLVTVLEADEGVLGYSRYNANQSFGSNPFYYIGNTLDGGVQPVKISQETTPSTQLADGQFLGTQFEILSEPAMAMKVRIGSAAQPPVSVTGVTLAPVNLELSVGENRQFTATVSPSNAANKKVSWSSSNTGVATVSNTGLVTAKAAGSTTITVVTEDGRKTASSTVTVTAGSIPVQEITLNKTSTIMEKGKTFRFTATIKPAEASNKVVEWSSSDNNVATVGTDGLVKAGNSGTAIITATSKDSGKTAAAEVVVDDHGQMYETATAVGIGTVNGMLTYTGDHDYFKFTAPEAGNYIFKSESAIHVQGALHRAPSYATLGDGDVHNHETDGQFMIKWNFAKGETLYLSVIPCKGSTGEYKVSIQPETFVEKVTVSPVTFNLEKKAKRKLTATVLPATAPNKTVRWTSSDETVAKVSVDGMVEAVNEGKAVITATSEDGGKAASSEVTVDDHGNNYETATVVAVGTVQGNLLHSGDHDYFKFTAPKAGKYIFWSESDNHVQGAIHRAPNYTPLGAGDVHNHDTDGQFHIEWDFAEGETLYLSVIPCKGSTGAYKVTIQPDSLVDSVAISPASFNLEKKGKRKLTATVLPSTVPNKKVQWTSSDEAVAKVSSDGTVEAVGGGKAMITATSEDGGRTAHSEVTVDDHGHTYETATTIGLGTIKGQLLHSGDHDYFRFIAPEAGTYVFSSASSVHVQGAIHRAPGYTPLGAGDVHNHGGDGQFAIEWAFTKGETLYLSVIPCKGSTGEYSVTVQPKK
ncbi:Ig-like domain-containing protein [Enterococcus sp. LJL128]